MASGAHYPDGVQEAIYYRKPFPSMEISTKTHLLALSTMIHVVRKQIKCALDF